MAQLPRIALPLPVAPAAARTAWALASELAGAATLELVLVGGAEMREPPGELPLVPGTDPRRLAEPLAVARARAGCVCVRAEAGEAPGEAARRLMRAGWLDACLLLEPAPELPRLRLRAQQRVVEPFPGMALPRLLEELDAASFQERLRQAQARLRALGQARPRLLLFDLRGAQGLEAAARAARGAGLDLQGPLRVSDLLRRAGDALVALSEAQAELPLAYAGAGPETLLALGEACAWPRPLETAAALLAAQRLARVAAAGELAAAREEARKPAVSIASRQRAPEEEERCPYCHRLLGESSDSERADPGPPVTCAACGTAHHRGCLAEHGRCTVLGCKGTRARRLGLEVPIARLGAAEPVRFPFHTLDGDPALGSSWLRVEAPIDDPEAVPRARRLRVELSEPRVLRGSLLQGYVVVATPRALRVRGGALRLRATLTTQDLRRGTAPRAQTILDRRASFVGLAPASALGRLQDGVVSLFGANTGVAIPAGTRRYPFSFRVHRDHPATVENRRAGLEESVRTRLEVALDTDQIELDLVVA